MCFKKSFYCALWGSKKIKTAWKIENNIVKKIFGVCILLSSVVEFLVKKILTRSIPYFIFAVRTVSSVGSEHYFDRVGVTGSSPVQSTIFYYNRLAINYFMKYKNY